MGMSGADSETSTRTGAPALTMPADEGAAQDDGDPQSRGAAPSQSTTPEASATEAAALPTEAGVAAPEAAEPLAPSPSGSTASEISEETPPPRPDSTAGEVELKLLVDADRLADFNEAPAIVAHARNKGTRKRLKSVYYDTADHILRQNGLSLRVRQSGARFVQTVKAESGEDPLRRGEWEASVASLAPDVGLAMPFVPAKLRDDLRRQPLIAVFTADIRRHQRLVDMAEGTVEVAFDQGSLTAGERTLPVSEIEIELKQGSPSAIYALALDLAEHGPLRPSIRSKAARGFDLAVDAPPPAKTPRRLVVDPAQPLDAAFAAILGACLRDLLVSMPAAEDGRDPEGVHQVRVTLRRLRSALDSMGTMVRSATLDALREDARWLASSLSAARTWDIFGQDILPAVAGNCPAVAGFDVLAAGAEARRLAAYRDVRETLGGSRSARFVIRLGAWLEARGWRDEAGPEGQPLLAEPAFSFARRVLSIHHAKVLKRGRHFKSLAAAERHRLRLAVKKLRYVTDFLLPLCTDRKAAKQFTMRLAELQEELGAFNDMATTGVLLTELVAGAAEGGTAAAAIAGWQAHAMVDAEARLRSAWRVFARTRTPWSPQDVL